jgi:hypothetical protein
MDTEALARSQAKRINALEAKLTHLQKKFDSLHKAFITINDISVVPSSHPGADLAPVEMTTDPEAKITVLAVAGMAMKLGMAPREFRNALLGQKCNFIFIKDFKQAWYQHGLVGLTSNIHETAEYLKTILPPQTESLRVIGTSAGGFGAVHLGVRMGADKVLAFGPQTKIALDTFKHFETTDSDRSAFDFQARDNDLRSLLEDYKDYAGKVYVYYSAANERDSAHAQRLAGIPQVHLRPIDNDQHNVASFLKQTDQLDTVLSEFLAA